MSEHPDPAIRATVQRLIDRGSEYDIESLEQIYDDDLYLLMVDEQGSLTRVDRAQNLADFAARRRAGDAPLSKEAEWLRIEQQGEQAVVLLRRRMHEDSPSRLFELRLRKVAGDWKVNGETVTPWPAREVEAGTRSAVDRLFGSDWFQTPPEQLAQLFSEDVDFLLAGDVESAPWFGRRRGRAGVAEFFRLLRSYIANDRFDIAHVIVDDDHAIVLGELVSTVTPTGGRIESEFCFDLVVEAGLIRRFRMFEDSFAVAKAASSARAPAMGRGPTQFTGTSAQSAPRRSPAR